MRRNNYNSISQQFNYTYTTVCIKGAVARKRKLFKFELRNVVILEFNLWENIARNVYYTILYYTIGLGGGLYALALHVQ